MDSKEDCSNLHSGSESSSSKLASAQAKIVDLESQNTNLQANVDSKASVLSMKAAEVEVLEGQIGNVEAARQELDQEVNSRLLELDTAKQALALSTDKLVEVSTMLNAAEDRLAAKQEKLKEGGSPSSTLEKTPAELTEAKSEEQSLQQEGLEHEDEIKSLYAGSDILSSQESVFQKELELLQQDVDAVESKNRVLQDAHDDAQEAVQDLRLENVLVQRLLIPNFTHMWFDSMHDTAKNKI